MHLTSFSFSDIYYFTTTSLFFLTILALAGIALFAISKAKKAEEELQELRKDLEYLAKEEEKSKR